MISNREVLRLFPGKHFQSFEDPVFPIADIYLSTVRMKFVIPFSRINYY